VVAAGRILDEQLGQLIDSERMVQDASQVSDSVALVARASESHQTVDLAGASVGNADDGPDRRTGA
jgi:hypothetical protein